MNNNLITYFYIILLITLFIASPLSAQKDFKEDDLNMMVEKGFQQYKHKEKIAFEPGLEKELKATYLKKLRSLSPKDFYDKAKAKDLIAYYSKPNGIEEILAAWVSATEVSYFEKIYSVDMELYMKIYFAAKEPSISPYIGENMLNKYSNLIVEIQPKDVKGDIYLNNKFVCTSSDALNGIRIPSDKDYIIEVSPTSALFSQKP
ncbi:MAG: hypothetical protein AB1480_07645 [Nitrospirota bacterium]